ncbi:MAG: hypothetical protein JRN11_05545 [Nitrososphaerota archaeon]|nr:hypothetical protein [Nitrososphaerota archaeon]MDG7013114.1 hypothetical protein [Nitrososphaerota archaeon]MDG7026195.1 hypothetical protein [Nitrososphaerota archaeon]
MTPVHGVPNASSTSVASRASGPVVYDALLRVRNRPLVLKLTDAIVIDRIDGLCSRIAVIEWLQHASHLTFFIPQDSRTSAQAHNHGGCA